MKKKLKKILGYFFYYLGVHWLVNVLRYILKGPNFVILVYHSFSNDRSENLSLNNRVFEKQMKHLKRNYHVQSLHEVISAVARKEKVKRNTVCITIDDGFLDNYEIAYPVLKAYGIPATIFVASRYICGQGLGQEGDIGRNYEYRNEPGQRKAAGRPDNTYRMPKMPMMSWDQLKDMARDDITIGSHTLCHPILTRIPLPEAKREIQVSKEEIEKNIGQKVEYFAFPNGLEGDYNEDLCRIVRDAGYQAAFTVRWGTNYITDDPFKLKRIPVGDLNLPEFAAIVSLIMSNPKG